VDRILLSTDTTDRAVSDEVLRCRIALEDESDRTDDCPSSSVSAAEVSVVSAVSVDHEVAGIFSFQVATEDDGDVTDRSDNSAGGENGAGIPKSESAVYDAVCAVDVDCAALDHKGSRRTHPAAEETLEVGDLADG